MLFSKENITKLSEYIKPYLEIATQISKHPDIIKLLEFLDNYQNDNNSVTSSGDSVKTSEQSEGEIADSVLDN